MYDMRFYRMHIHLHTHTLFVHVYTRSGYSSVRPLCVRCARELVHVRVRANRRFTQTRSIVLRGMRTEVWVHPRVHVYVDPQCVRATRWRVHRRH